jgi:RNA polymerase sigma factor for flagellar operon FliA
MAKDSPPIDALWKRFARDRSDVALRNALAVHYQPLVESLARRLAARLPAQLDVDDLASAGQTGLLDAVHRFDPRRGNHFATFAALRIRGAMIDHLRALDVVPRSRRGRVNRRRLVNAELTHSLARAPCDRELARGLWIEPAELPEWAAPELRSLSRPVADADDAGRQVERAQLVADPRDTRPDRRSGALDGLKPLLRGLAEMDRLIVLLYYAEGLTMKEIGQSLGRSESRISQRHTAIVQQIKTRLRRHANEP